MHPQTHLQLHRHALPTCIRTCTNSLHAFLVGACLHRLCGADSLNVLLVGACLHRQPERVPGGNAFSPGRA
eukprot:6194573-Alexandrium_andersonii.AAC.1